MKKRLLIALCLLPTAAIWAEYSPACPRLHVIENAPIGFKNTKGLPTGVHWDYLTEIEKISGLCLDKELLPYPRIWQNIKLGEHDGGIIFKSASRSKFVEYVAHIRSVKTVVIAMNGIKINSYADLQHIRIGKTRGTHLSEQFDQDSSLNIIELSNYAQAAKMINRRRIDAIAGSALVLSYQLKKYNVLDNVDLTNKLVLGEKEQWLQLSKKSQHLDKIPQLKRAIGKLKNDGSFDAIMDEYYGEKWILINQ
ncbi:MAG: transporter substrate-binding domain-containing protein [Oleispira sp.]